MLKTRMKKMKGTQLLQLALPVIFFIFSFSAQAQAPNFTYQARLIDTTTNQVYSGTQPVTVIFAIYDPSGSCLLYAETGTSSTVTNGVLVWKVGSAPAALRRYVGISGPGFN